MPSAKSKQFFYMLTNKYLAENSIPLIKTGVSNDVESLVSKLNASKEIPGLFEVYTSIEINNGFSFEDSSLYKLLRILDPQLKLDESSNYFIYNPEQMKRMLEAIAFIYNDISKQITENNDGSIAKQTIADKSNLRASSENSTPHYQNSNLPPLKDLDAKIGDFIFSNMKALSESGYVFSDSMLLEMQTSRLQKYFDRKVKIKNQNYSFIKVIHDPSIIYVEKKKNGTIIERVPPSYTEERANSGEYYSRFHPEVLRFGSVRVLVSKEWYEKHRKPFIKWYNSLNTQTTKSDKQNPDQIPDEGPEIVIEIKKRKKSTN